MKTNILFISHSSVFYGAEQSLFYLLKYLDRNRFEPFILCPDDKGILFEKVKALGITTFTSYSPWWIDNAEKSQLAFNIMEELQSVREIVHIIKQNKIDIVYTNTLVKINGGIASKLCGIPHIFHIREIIETQQLNSVFSNEITFNIVNFFSDKIIAVSQAVKKQLLAFFEEKKIDVVYNAVDTSSFEDTYKNSNFRRELKADEDCSLIGIVGSIKHHKGHEYLLEAFSEILKYIKRVKLIIVGAVNDNQYISYLDTIIDKYKLRKNVIFTGFRADIPQIMQALDVLIVPSIGEPFGRAIIEAMAAGKPVVATNTGASPEIVTDGITGYLVDPQNAGMLAQAIIKVLSDPQNATKMGSKGRELVRREFTIQRYISNIEKTFSEISSIRYEKKPMSHEDIISEVYKIVGPSGLAAFMKYYHAQINELIRQIIEEKDEQIESITNTWSWEITSPLRWLGRLIKYKG